MTITRLRPDVVVRKNSPNQSGRDGVPLLIVLHSTESYNYPGTRDLEGVASWFANPESEVSSHVIVDADGHSARCVPDKRKAWHDAAYNSLSLGIEQVGIAAQKHWDRAEWMESCRWIAYWSHEFHIPIRRAYVSHGVVLRSGVTTHKKLGIEGGGHIDPGVYFPLRRVLRQARHIKTLRYPKE